IKRIYALLLTVIHVSRIWIETGFQLRTNRWVIPDICVTHPDQERKHGWFHRSPMLAIEVASRGNTAEDLQQKVEDYLENGAAEVIVIYPRSRTMIVYRALSGETSRIGPDDDYHCQLVGVTFTPEYRTETE